jgi:hypothetical protein
VGNGGTFNMNIGPLTFKNGLTVNGGTIVSRVGTFNFDTNNQSIGGSSAFTINNISVGSGITVTNTSTTGITTDNLSGGGTWLQDTNALLVLNGSSTSLTSLNAAATGNTVKYASSSIAQTIKSATYYDLIIDKSSTTATLGDAIVVNNDLTINSGTLDASSGNNYPITVKGDWVNNGTFTPRSGTVYFSGIGDQTINDSNTWYGLVATSSVARTLYFESGATQTISSGGSLTLQGALSNLLSLAPLTPATDWLLRVSTSSVTQDISYVSPSYSDAGTLGVDATIDASDGTNDDSGAGNTNWNFSGTLSYSISDNSIGFGALSPSVTKYATGDTSGSGSETVAHTLSVSGPAGGYSLLVQGDSPACASHGIDAIGGSNTAPATGVEQFGIRLDASGGTGSVTAPYAASGYAYDATANTTSQVGGAVGTDSGTTYSVYYVGNVAAETESCDYSTNINYIMVPNF